MELKISMSDKHHRYYKHTKFRQNPRGDPKFLVDLTWNDPIIKRLLCQNGVEQKFKYSKTNDIKCVHICMLKIQLFCEDFIV